MVFCVPSQHLFNNKTILQTRQKYLFREHRKTVQKKTKDLNMEAFNFRTNVSSGDKIGSVGRTGVLPFK